MFATIHDLKPVTLPSFRDSRGVLVPLDVSSVIPFPVVRVFWIYDVPVGGTRGAHAHKTCHQFMICATGLVRVETSDGKAESVIALTAGQALHVPPGIFSTERFEKAHTTLMVFCDRPYERDDYLVDNDEFLTFRRKASHKSEPLLG